MSGVEHDYVFHNVVNCIVNIVILSFSVLYQSPIHISDSPCTYINSIKLPLPHANHEIDVWPINAL